MRNFRKKRKKDRLNRIKTIIIYILVISLITVTILALSMTSIREVEKKDTKFKELSDIDYKVNLKKNEFFENEYLNKNNQYIASLIDNIEANFTYELKTLEKEEKCQYTYRIEAEINVLEKSTHKPLYTSKEIIVPETKDEFNNDLKINKKVYIDYNKYNYLIQKFINTYELDNNESTVSINMYVNILNESIKRNNEKSVSTLDIPLTKKTVAIEVGTSTLNENEIHNNNVTKEHYIGILLIILDLILIIKLIIYINGTKDEESLYKMKLKNILYNYSSCIQKINRNFDYTGYQSIEVNTFENLLQIREMVQEPILMLEREEEAHFMIPTQTKIMYIYELNSGSKKKRLESKEEN